MWDAAALHWGLCLVALGLVVSGCSLGGPREAAPRARAVAPELDRAMAPVLRGLIGAEVSFGGVEPVLVTGFGLVVGVNGTGGEMLPSEALASHMEREMSLMGIGRGAPVSGTLLAHPDGTGKTPRELLNDPEVAVVVVYARIPPGLPEGKRFDVFVQALNASSLRGGVLWTTELEIGRAQPFGGRQKRIIAEAKGPVFVNPYSSPGSPGESTTGRAVGRVLNGGVVTEPLDVLMQLDNPSHTRARSIASAINTRFPAGPMDRTPTARGMDDENIALSVPHTLRDRPEDFVRMVQHLPIDTRVPAEQYAIRYTEAIQAEPALAEQLSWALRAVGPDVLPTVRDLYDHPQRVVRLAALTVGVHFRDGTTLSALETMASSGTTNERAQAIEMLGRIEAGPSLDASLGEMVNNADPVVRIAAYESLATRAQRTQRARIESRRNDRFAAAAGEGLPEGAAEILSKTWLPEGTIHGVSREPIGDKFLLDRVRSDRPMIYVTQQGRPTIALFGEVQINRPSLATAWDDRFILVSNTASDRIRLRYEDYRTGRETRQDVSPDVAELIRFMAHTPSPEDPRPGLGMGYSDVVGVLHALWRAGALNAEFTTERDRLLIQLIEATRGADAEPRPERPGQEIEQDPLPIPDLPDPNDAPDRDDGGFRPRIVPIEPPEGSDRGGR